MAAGRERLHVVPLSPCADYGASPIFIKESTISAMG